MNSTANGRPVVPRTGFIVEFNALWYNALCFGAKLAQEAHHDDIADILNQKADKAKDAFLATFVNKFGYLFDYVDGESQDWSVRPNMIFPAAFDYSPLSQEQKKMSSTSAPKNCSHRRDSARCRQRAADTTPCM